MTVNQTDDDCRICGVMTSTKEQRVIVLLRLQLSSLQKTTVLYNTTQETED